MKINTNIRVMKFYLSILLTTFCLSTSAIADDDIKKVVYHADFSEPKRFGTMLRYIFNMSTVYENDLKEYDILIVLIAAGIRFVTNNNLKGTAYEADKAFIEERKNLFKRIASLQELRGIKLELCQETLNSFKLKESELIPSIKLVPLGVVQIADLQRKGFSYIKID